MGKEASSSDVSQEKEAGWLILKENKINFILC